MLHVVLSAYRDRKSSIGDVGGQHTFQRADVLVNSAFVAMSLIRFHHSHHLYEQATTRYNTDCVHLSPLLAISKIGSCVE